MGLISLSAINTNDAANPDLFNSRFAAIVAVINGNVDAANLKDNSITYSKFNLLANDIPVSKIGMTPNVTTNAGTAGGTLNYIQIGTFLMYWGTTASVSAPFGTITSFTLTFPVAFAVAPTVTATALTPSKSEIMVFENVAPTTSGATLTVNNVLGGSSTSTLKMDWHAIGRSA